MSRALLCKMLHQMAQDFGPTFAPGMPPQAMQKVSTVIGDDGLGYFVFPSQVCADAVEQIEKDLILAMKYKCLLHGMKNQRMDPLYQFIMHETIEDGYEFLKTRESI